MVTVESDGAPEEAVPEEATLFVCSGVYAGRRYAISDHEIVMGRAGSASIPLEDERVSLFHAKLIRERGRHRIIDLGSSNGTFLNEVPVDDAELRHGDYIRVGETVFQYVTQAEMDTVAEISFERSRDLSSRDLPSHAMVLRDASAGYRPPEFYRDPSMGGYIPSHHGSQDVEEGEASIKDFVFRILRVIAFFRPYWRTILIAMLVGVVLGGLSFFVLPPKRRAVFEVSLMPGAAENPVQRFERSNVEFFRSAQQNFKSLSLIEKTLTALGDADLSEGRISALQTQLEFTPVPPANQNTYRGTYSTEDPEFSVKFLDMHAKLYLETELEKTLKVIRVEVDFLAKQLLETEKDLKRTETELLEFKKKNIDGLPEQARQYYDYLFDLKRRQGETDKELNRIRALSRIDREKLKSEDPLVESRILATRPYQNAIVDVNRQIAEGKASGMGSDHPQIQRLMAQAEELKALARGVDSGGATEVERQRNPVYSNIQDALHQLEAAEEGARRESSRVTQDLARVRGIVDRLPELEATYAELTRSYDATKALHTRIFQQLKATQLQLELERASAAARYDIITPPTLEFISPVKKVAERGIIFGFLGFAVGLAYATVCRLKEFVSGKIQTVITRD